MSSFAAYGPLPAGFLTPFTMKTHDFRTLIRVVGYMLLSQAMPISPSPKLIRCSKGSTRKQVVGPSRFSPFKENSPRQVWSL